MTVRIITSFAFAVVVACQEIEEPPVDDRTEETSEQVIDEHTQSEDTTHQDLEDTDNLIEDQQSRGQQESDLPEVICGDTYPGIPMMTGLIEDESSYSQSYEEEVSNYMWSHIPDPLDISSVQPFFKSLIQYMLHAPNQQRFSHEAILQHGATGEAVLNAFIDGYLNTDMLRRGFHYAYYCSQPIPGSLDELRATFGDYKDWDNELMDCGAPKDLPRHVYRNEDFSISVAETLDLSGNVRETEIIFSTLRDDGQLDFAAYTENGELTDRSGFATFGGQDIFSASPYTCLTCHIDRNSNRFDNIHPVGTGAGCQL